MIHRTIKPHTFNQANSVHVFGRPLVISLPCDANYQDLAHGILVMVQRYVRLYQNISKSTTSQESAHVDISGLFSLRVIDRYGSSRELAGDDTSILVDFSEHYEEYIAVDWDWQKLDEVYDDHEANFEELHESYLNMGSKEESQHVVVTMDDDVKAAFL